MTHAAGRVRRKPEPTVTTGSFSASRFLPRRRGKHFFRTKDNWVVQRKKDGRVWRSFRNRGPSKGPQTFYSPRFSECAAQASAYSPRFSSNLQIRSSNCVGDRWDMILFKYFKGLTRTTTAFCERKGPIKTRSMS